MCIVRRLALVDIPGHVSDFRKLYASVSERLGLGRFKTSKSEGGNCIRSATDPAFTSTANSQMSKLRRDPNVRVHIRYIAHKFSSITDARIRVHENMPWFHEERSFFLVFTVVVPGAPQDIMRVSLGWRSGVKLLSEAEYDLLIKDQ